MFHCNSNDMSELVMLLNNAPVAGCNFEVKQAFSYGKASIGFVRGCLKCEFPTGLRLELFIVNNGNILTGGTNNMRYLQRKYNDL